MSKKGPWKAAYLCVKCQKEMSYHSMMYNNAVCPYCGNAGSGTIVDCIIVSKRRVYRWVYRKWPKFWKGYWEYKK